MQSQTYKPTTKIKAEAPSGKVIQKKNRTGLPDQLKNGIESLSGYSMDDVKVHYNSNRPSTLQAHAYAQGTDIHLGPGQEKHLPHEAWHVVQQKQGRVKPTLQMQGGLQINDEVGLEKEADLMGTRSLQLKSYSAPPIQLQHLGFDPVIQMIPANRTDFKEFADLLKDGPLKTDLKDYARGAVKEPDQQAGINHDEEAQEQNYEEAQEQNYEGDVKKMTRKQKADHLKILLRIEQELKGRTDWESDLSQAQKEFILSRVKNGLADEKKEYQSNPFTRNLSRLWKYTGPLTLATQSASQAILLAGTKALNNLLGTIGFGVRALTQVMNTGLFSINFAATTAGKIFIHVKFILEGLMRIMESLNSKWWTETNKDSTWGFIKENAARIIKILRGLSEAIKGLFKGSSMGPIFHGFIGFIEGLLTSIINIPEVNPEELVANIVNVSAKFIRHINQLINGIRKWWNDRKEKSQDQNNRPSSQESDSTKTNDLSQALIVSEGVESNRSNSMPDMRINPLLSLQYE